VKRLSGIVPPVCTPLTPEFEVDVPSLARLVDFLLDAGVDGLFVLGSTSETAYLPDGHRRQVIETVVARAAGRVPVLAGVIDMTTLRVLEHVRTAVRLGCDGVVATAPFYARTHPAEIDRHFRMIAETSDVPVFAYDLPVSVHSKLSADLVLRLAADGVLAGVKDSSGDEAGLRALTLRVRERGLPFSVLTGSELTADSALRTGCDGIVPGLGNVDPHGYVRLYKQASQGNWDSALEEQERLLRLFELVTAGSPERMGPGSSALGAFKAALKLRGVIDCAVTAPPQIPLLDNEIEHVGKCLSEAGLQ
jgi:4-hydroxy-tetrahydrodipicolinate synthase